MQRGDVASGGPAFRARPRRRPWAALGRAPSAEGAGPAEPRVAPSQRESARGQRVFRSGRARPPVQAMIAFINEHRACCGSSRWQGAVDPPGDPSRPRCPGRRSCESAAGRAPRRRSLRQEPPGPVGDLRRLRRPQGMQGMSATGPRRDRRRAVPDRPPDAPDEADADRSRNIRESCDHRQGGALPARPGEPALQPARIEQDPGLRLHVRHDLGGRGRRGVRQRRLCPPHRRLARIAHRYASLVLDSLGQASRAPGLARGAVANAFARRGAKRTAWLRDRSLRHRADAADRAA